MNRGKTSGIVGGLLGEHRSKSTLDSFHVSRSCSYLTRLTVGPLIFRKLFALCAIYSSFEFFVKFCDGFKLNFIHHTFGMCHNFIELVKLLLFQQKKHVVLQNDRVARRNINCLFECNLGVF